MIQEQITEGNKLVCDECNGEGYIIGLGWDSGCCGNPLRNGECCGNAIMIEVQQQCGCEKCKGTGFIINQQSK